MFPKTFKRENGYASIYIIVHNVIDNYFHVLGLYSSWPKDEYVILGASDFSDTYTVTIGIVTYIDWHVLNTTRWIL